METLRRYGMIYWIFFRNVLVESMVYRFNFFLMVGINSGWFFIQLLTYGLIFYRVKSLAGWTPWQVVLLASTWQVIFCTFIAVFVTNLSNISWFVRTGEMDFVLARPISTLFYMSFNRLELGSLASLGIGIATLGFAFSKVPGLHLSLAGLAAYLGLLLCGIGTLYSLMLLIVSAAFWTTRASSVQGLFWALQEFGGYPAEIYGSMLRWFLTFIVPVAVIANVPARVLLHGVEPRGALAASGATAVLFIIARFVFYKGLSQYRSASS